MRGTFVSCYFGVILMCSLCLADEEASSRHDDHLVRHRRDDEPRTTNYRIATILAKPYTMYDVNKKLVGFIPDLVKLIADNLDFKYDFELYANYGRDDGTGVWSGMIGALMAKQKGNASVPDFAAADLTLSLARREVVDFVYPFNDIGLTILIQKPHYNTKTDAFTMLDFDPYGFTILSPLTAEVWALVTLCVLAVALALWAFNKFNPYEWEGRYGIGLATKEEAEAFSLASSLWFTFSTLQWQGFEKAPRSWAGKILSVFWFCFVTIILVTYTAGIVNNLFFASLVHERDPLFNRIHSLAELVQHPHGYSYGVVRGGSTHTYLKDVAKGEEFDVIRNHITSQEGQRDLVSSVDEGIGKVRTEKYAFIVESLTAKYLSNQRPCDLMTVGEVFAKRNFGMATPKGSNLTQKLDSEILRLRETGKIQELEDKWFAGNRQCWNVTLVETVLRKQLSLDVNRPKKVDMRIFWGPLVMIITGLVLSSLVCLAETIWYKTRGRYSANNRPQGQVLQEDRDDVPDL
ncbi:hypothetical protein CAPTEDRAFT_164454 [Capitella teleta]|uniref:Ionotropic glutamate receptor C-terminal domain-containing protein n=1 Tax=Capitella teleta TaxID=283909 RepID=R7VFZ1_CAPTE|nr:hypothetical protein CAPTEDRAFT_164454 [Capitella teleta]|eukprot:ELU17492.1 hypothetical protein CAPTEDRAFT_164454 [Capitella teleta]